MAIRRFLMNKKKIISAALIISLGTMGAGYASWNDSVHLSANVSTMKMDIEMSPEYHCRWYRISFGCITGVVKVKVDVLPMSNEINVEVTRLISETLSKNKEYIINIPFFITNTGSSDIDSYLLHYWGEDRFISSGSNSIIRAGESGLRLLKIDIMKVQDGKSEFRFKPVGLGAEFPWQESIHINVDRRTAKDILGSVSYKKSIEKSIREPMPLESMMRTRTTLNYLGGKTEIGIENGDMLVELISEEEGQHLLSKLIEEEIEKTSLPDTNKNLDEVKGDQEEDTEVDLEDNEVEPEKLDTVVEEFKEVFKKKDTENKKELRLDMGEEQ